MRQHRQESQQPIVEIWKELFQLGRFPRRCAKLLRKVRLRGEAAGSAPVRFGAWAAHRIQPASDSFFAASAADLSDVNAMHRFRIAGKKLRYVIELLAPAFSENLRTQAYPAIQDLQERLGKINDLAAAQARLKRWLEHGDGAEEAAYLREMLAEEQRRLEQRRAEFLAWWNGGREAELRQRLTALVPDPSRRLRAPAASTYVGVTTYVTLGTAPRREAGILRGRNMRSPFQRYSCPAIFLPKFFAVLHFQPPIFPGDLLALLLRCELIAGPHAARM